MTITTFNLFLGKSDSPSLARRDAVAALAGHGAVRARHHRPAARRRDPGGVRRGRSVYLRPAARHRQDAAGQRAAMPSSSQIAETARRRSGVRFHEVEARSPAVRPRPWSARRWRARWNLPPPLVRGHRVPPHAARRRDQPAADGDGRLANEIAHFLRCAPATDDATALARCWQACRGCDDPAAAQPEDVCRHDAGLPRRTGQGPVAHVVLRDVDTGAQ